MNRLLKAEKPALKFILEVGNSNYLLRRARENLNRIDVSLGEISASDLVLLEDAISILHQLLGEMIHGSNSTA